MTATTRPVCPEHDRVLICPACIGTAGGAVRSRAKTIAARKNARRPRPRRPGTIVKGTLAGVFLLMAATAHADGEWLWTNPADGARLNTYGPGTHMDAFGRAYETTPRNAWVFEPVRPNVYGPGSGQDTLGRTVSPSLRGFGEIE